MTDDTDIEAQPRAIIHARDPLMPEEAIERSRRSPEAQKSTSERISAAPRWTRRRSGFPGNRPSARAAVSWAVALVVAILAVTLSAGIWSSSRLAPTTKPPRTTSPDRTTAPRRPVAESVWPFRVLAQSPHSQDIIPTSNALYWLQLPRQYSNAESVVPVRYDEITHQVTKGGPSVQGGISSSALTVTGGWVWVVLGVGSNEVILEQLNAESLALHKRITLSAVDNTSSAELAPVLSATVDGPLWIAAAKDLWALNPLTGAVETEFDTGNEITSISTDPTGTYLYTGAEQNRPVVTAYNAQTGQELKRVDIAGMVSPQVSATIGAVWTSALTAPAAYAKELSARTLRPIAEFTVKKTGPYYPLAGISPSVSGGALWLENSARYPATTLTCANPSSGAIRAQEKTTAGYTSLIADNGLVYALAGQNLVVLTPPVACFR